MQSLETIRDEDIDSSLLQEIPLSFLRNNLLMPLRKEDGFLRAAVSDDKGVLALLEIAGRYGLKPFPLKAPQGVIIDAMNRVYGQIGTAQEVMEGITGEDLSSVATEFESPKDLLELTEEAPIIRLLNALLQQAVKEKASDIHVEPYEKELDVRMRIDGILRKVLTPPKIIQDALISRVKIMASMDIAEKRLPQDGRIRLLIGGRDIDIRVSIVPTSLGERAVLRLLDRKQGIKGLYEVGLDETDGKRFEELLARTSGIILVTGPTGSGKTTTLYAALNKVHTEEKNIITVEDPVEYQLKGIGQIQVNPKIGLTFASGLRSILRQDPDVIMVGEIRDVETAEIAIQASLTGHLVLSTLHTNDAASAITRLVDMGMEPFLVASSLVAVLAQRLVRKICPNCRRAYEPASSEATYFSSFTHSSPLTLFRGEGCERCKGTGYSGRTGIFELLPIDSEVRQMITASREAQSIKDAALSRGMKTLYLDGLRKALNGETTLEEVLRVTQKDYVEG
ncbi:MAG TPA: type II secretion system ATPase GspE [Thermodesulfovibrionales bacterium]|jgi:general secretion pathway protein E|nr:type II secretion system ATPase GspE [Thermodesulfovibrionales bacterium]